MFPEARASKIVQLADGFYKGEVVLVRPCCQVPRAGNAACMTVLSVSVWRVR